MKKVSLILLTGLLSAFAAPSALQARGEFSVGQASGAICRQIDHFQAAQEEAEKNGDAVALDLANREAFCCSSGYVPGTAISDCCLAHAAGGKREVNRFCSHVVLPTRFVCGNGILEPGEACDDGNKAEDDSCSSDCKTTQEPPSPPPPPPPPAESLCDQIADPELKNCCDQHGGLTFEAVQECLPDSEDPSEACHLIVNVSGDVNGQMNVCCQYVNNSGVIQDADVVQECENAFQGGSEIQPAAPVIVSGETEETAVPGAFAKGGCSLGSGSSGEAFSVEFIFMGLVLAAVSIFRSRKIDRV